MKIGKAILVWLGAVAALVACSSTPEREANVAPSTQEAYAEYAEERLENWSDRADDLSEDRKRRMDVAIKDARIELEGLRAAPGTEWESYRDRVEGALDNIESIHDESVAE